MKKLIILSIMLSSLAISNANAKRMADRSGPERVTPVKSGQIEYRAPSSKMGYVEAWDTKQNKMLWRKQIYTVTYNADLEKDVQDVFITSLKVKAGSLIITNERKSKYQLNLKTLDLKVLKGALVEDRG